MSSSKRNLNSRQIEVFRAVMIGGSLMAASRALRVAQPSLSRMIRRIEDVVGFALFERAKGRLSPTPDARLLFNSVEHIQAQIDDLGSVIDQIGKGGAGLFRLGTSPSLGRLVPDVLANMREHYPSLRLQLDVVTLAGITDYLALGLGECFVSMTKIQNPAVSCSAIGPGRLVVLLPAHHPLAEHMILDASQLVGHPLIMCEAGSPHARLVHDFFAESGLEPRSSVTVRFAELAIGMTMAGLGVAVVDEFTALGATSPALAVRPIRGVARFQVHLSRSVSHPVSRFLSTFEAALRARLTMP